MSTFLAVPKGDLFIRVCLFREPLKWCFCFLLLFSVVFLKRACSQKRHTHMLGWGKRKSHNVTLETWMGVKVQDSSSIKQGL